MAICGTLVWLLAVSSVPVGASLPDDPLPPDLLKASQEYDKAQLNNDGRALTRLLGDNLVLISGSGRAQSKTEFIRDSTAPGSLGILILAKHRGSQITLHPAIARMRQHGIWLSNALEAECLHAAGE